jgi:methyl-accepting chemotaxis protein
MNSISIRAALTSMFAALMAAIALVGAMGLWELHQINANVVAIGTNWLPSVNATRKLQVDQSTFRIREARHILSADSDEMKKIEQQLVEARSEIEEGMKVYDKLVSSSEERTGYNKIQEGLGQYFHLHEEAIQLSRESKKDEATALFNGELTKKGIEVRGYIDTVVALNEKGAATEVDTSTELYSDAFMVLSIVIGVSLLIGCASIGFMLVRVMRPIGAMTDAMGVLAGGDTEVVIPGQGRADEIGKMANAVQIFKDNMLETERLRQEQEEAEMRSVEQRKTDMRNPPRKRCYVAHQDRRDDAKPVERRGVRIGRNFSKRSGCCRRCRAACRDRDRNIPASAAEQLDCRASRFAGDDHHPASG